jgi:hypothetical protein
MLFDCMQMERKRARLIPFDKVVRGDRTPSVMDGYTLIDIRGGH